MGEPATELYVMDSAKDSRDLDLGLKKVMALDLDGFFLNTILVFF